jgi:hypothetical protein
VSHARQSTEVLSSACATLATQIATSDDLRFRSPSTMSRHRVWCQTGIRYRRASDLVYIWCRHRHPRPPTIRQPSPDERQGDYEVAVIPKRFTPNLPSGDTGPYVRVTASPYKSCVCERLSSSQDRLPNTRHGPLTRRELRSGTTHAYPKPVMGRYPRDLSVSCRRRSPHRHEHLQATSWSSSSP